MNRSGLLLGILFVVLLELTAFAAIHYSYQTRRDSYLHTEFEYMKRGYQSVLETYELFSRAVFNETINKPAVLQLMAAAGTADLQNQARLRQQLHRMILPSYQGLLQNHLNQIHFHLPDLDSFLRMHRPEVFGDNLADIRPALALANKRRSYVGGFEMGRHEGGFRFIFPLFWQQQFVGTAETSISFDSFTSQLKRRFPGEYLLLVKADVSQQRLFKNVRSRMVASPFHAGLLQLPLDESSPSDLFSPNDIQLIANQLRPDMAQAIAANKSAEFVAELQEAVSVVMLPLSNYEGITEAYLLQIKYDTNLDAIKDGYLVAAYCAALIALIAGAVIIAFYRKARSMAALNSLFLQAIDALPYPFHIIDTATYRIKVANRQAKADNKQPEEMTCYALSHGNAHPCGSEEHPCPVKLAVRSRQASVVEHLHQSADGTNQIVEVHGYPIFDADGQITRCVEYAIDITERRQMEEKLKQLAATDPLTGTANRRQFYDALELEISRAVRYGRGLAVLMLDVDHFKDINDNNGHDAGDNILCELVWNLSKVLRSSDLLARSGGDEFLIMAPETSADEVRLLAEKLLKIVQDELHTQQHGQVTISIGTAVLMPDDTADSLIKRADQALYQAKQQGRNCAVSSG